VSARTLLAWCHAWQGDFTGGYRLLDEATRLADDANHAGTAGSLALARGFFHFLQGKGEEAARDLEQALSIYRTTHTRAPAAKSFLAGAYTLVGRMDEALPLFAQSLEEAAAVKFLPCNSVWIVWWGEACLAAGNFDEAADLAVRALSIARAQQERGYEAHALHLEGAIAARRDPPRAVRAEAAYGEAMMLATALGMRPLLARCHLGLGRLYRHVGDRERARLELTTAADMLRAMDMRIWREQAEAERAALS
jgi:tetratricopeptide (TPR) repeat protein